MLCSVLFSRPPHPPALRPGQIDPFQNQRELGRANRETPLARLRHRKPEAATLEPLRKQRIAAVVVPENLGAIGAAIEEAEQVTRERILPESVLDQGREPVEGLALMLRSA